MWCVHRPNAGEILGRLTVTCSQFCMRYTSAWSTMTSSKEDRKSKSRALSLVREKVQILASYPVDVFLPNLLEVGMGIGTGDKANANTTYMPAGAGCAFGLGMWVWLEWNMHCMMKSRLHLPTSVVCAMQWIPVSVIQHLGQSILEHLHHPFSTTHSSHYTR